MRISIYHCSLAKLLDLQNVSEMAEHRLTLAQRGAIQEFRNNFLEQQYPELRPLVVSCNDFGKPIAINHPKLAFNQSHSQREYALAFSFDVRDLGVDIESLNRKIRFEALAKHAFHPQEYQCWKALGEDINYWFKVWTTKEAILKAHGMGIRLDLNTLNTQMHPTHDNGQIIDERLGIFAYQCFDLGHAMLSVAWRSGMGCGQFIVPNIQIINMNT
ncbi:4'-phosphopantetheinyl transferase superfamily protein [Acinetobacter sp. WU_MDCI_Axc73]|nr:4'-phosphopantetheinyl transferase superfamily protein [Acinetobacter sp. WU_MDCI_Axc73]